MLSVPPHQDETQVDILPAPPACGIAGISFFDKKLYNNTPLHATSMRRHVRPSRAETRIPLTRNAGVPSMAKCFTGTRRVRIGSVTVGGDGKNRVARAKAAAAKLNRSLRIRYRSSNLRTDTSRRCDGPHITNRAHDEDVSTLHPRNLARPPGR